MKQSSLSIFSCLNWTKLPRVLPLLNAASLKVCLVGCTTFSSLVGCTTSSSLAGPSPTASTQTNPAPGIAARGNSEHSAISAPGASASPATHPAQEAINSAQIAIAQLKIEILALKEKMATLQRKFDVVLKAQRSGIYDEPRLSTESLARLKNPPKTQNDVPPLASQGPLDRFEIGNEAELSHREKGLNPQSPQEIVERASLLLESREFGKVAQLLEDFQQRFPNNGLSSVAELTLAEAYVELKSPQQALTHIRTFYLQHPNDAQLVRAKWLEGRSQELLEAPQKAAQVYREIIALDPQSQLALKARTALEKIGGGGTQ